MLFNLTKSEKMWNEKILEQEKKLKTKYCFYNDKNIQCNNKIFISLFFCKDHMTIKRCNYCGNSDIIVNNNDSEDYTTIETHKYTCNTNNLNYLNHITKII